MGVGFAEEHEMILKGEAVERAPGTADALLLDFSKGLLIFINNKNFVLENIFQKFQLFKL